MRRFAAIVYPTEETQSIEYTLRTLGIQYKSLSIQEKYFFTVFSAADTVQLADARKFMLYMLSNKEQKSAYAKHSREASAPEASGINDCDPQK